MLRIACVLFPLTFALAGCSQHKCGAQTLCDELPDQATSMSRCPTPIPVSCTDQSIQDLNFYKDASPDTRAITNTPDGSGFISEIDAAAGGQSATESYVYARFTATGLEKVALGDEAALASMGWDIAFRRFIIRLNSGSAGPSCVDGTRAAISSDQYAATTMEPPGLTYSTEQYYTDSCDLVPDGSGLGSPGTVLQSFWRYPGCVQMTDNIFIIRLADGRKVKLMVTHYYEQSVQDYCDANDHIMPSDSGAAAKLGVRWAFLAN